MYFNKYNNIIKVYIKNRNIIIYKNIILNIKNINIIYMKV